MTIGRAARHVTMVGLAMVLAATPTPAQRLVEVGPPTVLVGLTLTPAQPVGEFADYVDFGFGVAGHGSWFPHAGPLGLRLDLGVIVYGRETRRFQLVPLIDVDVTTSNDIFSLFLGPEVRVGRGAVQPYAAGQVGFSYFSTESHVEGSDNNLPFANTTNFDDVTLAASGVGGLLIRLRRGHRPIFLDLGARYIANGEAEYLREGSITIVNNQVFYQPIRSATNLVVYHVGVSFGIGN